MAVPNATMLFSPHNRAEPRTVRLGIGVAAGLIALSGLAIGGVKLLLAIGALAALFAVIYAFSYARRHHDWLICCIILVILINEFSLLTPDVRAPFHYGALALFCLPVVATGLRSDLLRSGGFKLYIIYFFWAAITISYSLAPEYSLARLGEAFLLLVFLTAIVLDVPESGDASRLLAHFLVGAGLIVGVMALAAVLLPHSLTWQSPLASFTTQELRAMQKAGIAVDGVDRFQGLLSGPNDIGGLMLIVVGPAIVCWQTASTRARALLGVLIIVSMALAAMADSRSPFVALAIGGTLYSVWKWRARGILVLTAVAIAGAGALLIYSHGDLSAYTGRGVGTLTGRTDIWAFAWQKIKDRPIRGYGYEVSGAIFQSRYFPIWWGPWDLGPHSSLHDGYIDHAVGVGIPATLLWLFIILRPWFFVLRKSDDPWQLKSMFLLIVIPILIYNVTEVVLGEFADSVGLLFGLAWAIAERYRLLELERARAARAEAITTLPRAALALMWGR